MLVFDKQRKRCVAPPTADCDVPPTPPPSDDDEENGGDDGRPVRYENICFQNSVYDEIKFQELQILCYFLSLRSF